MKFKKKDYEFLIQGIFTITIVWLSVQFILKRSIIDPNPWDSYTLQAMVWRKGKLSMLENYKHLELALYKDNFYLSFPPMPTLIVYPLTFIFEDKVPTNFLMLLYLLASFSIAYRLFRIDETSEKKAFLWAIFLVLGSNLFSISIRWGSMVSRPTPIFFSYLIFFLYVETKIFL